MSKQSLQQKLNIQTTNGTNTNPFPTENSQYLYTPTQYLISNFLTTKKTIQDNLITTLKSIADIRTNPQINTGLLRQQLRSKREELQGIKRKLNKSYQQQTQVYDIMRKRVHMHQGLSVAGNKANNKTINSQPNIQLNNNQFSLELNKQIAYFMVDESIKRQQKLNYQQRLKQQLKQQLKQHKQGQSSNILLQGEQQQSDTVKDIPHNIQGLIMPMIVTDSLPFTFIQELSPNRIEIPLPTTEQQLLDIQRFFSMPGEDNLQMMYEFQQPDNNFFSRLREYISVTARHIGGERGVENNVSKKLVELGYTRRDLFDERKFISTIDNDGVGKQGRMDIQQGNHHDKDYQINQQGNYVDNKQHIKIDAINSSSFSDQLQLQCTLYRKQNQISHHILANNLQSVSQFLYENTHMVNKSNSHLQFWLTLCKAIQLIATKIQTQQMKALQLIRNMIAKLKSKLENWQKEELQKVTCMLLMPYEKISLQPYLKKTQQSFRAVFQQIYKLPDFTKFLHTIYTGALILKTPTCIEKDKQNPLICPLCNPLAEKVFNNIPLLTRNQSNLICRINGSVMDHENYPIMLPSYQIYSLKGLQDTKKKTKTSTGKVVEEYYCKFTQTWYNKQLAKKVFLA